MYDGLCSCLFAMEIQDIEECAEEDLIVQFRHFALSHVSVYFHATSTVLHVSANQRVTRGTFHQEDHQFCAETEKVLQYNTGTTSDIRHEPLRKAHFKFPPK